MRLQGLDGGTEACPGSVGECPPEESHCHTDAHIRTQEESSMWKIREIEKPVEDTCQEAKRKMLPNSSYQMCSDGFDEESQRGYWRPKSEIPGTQEDDFLRQNPGTRNYMIMALISKTDEVRVLIRSYTPRVKQIVVCEMLPMGRKYLPDKIIYPQIPQT